MSRYIVLFRLMFFWLTALSASCPYMLIVWGPPPMIHKSVEDDEISLILWKYRFRIGAVIRTGRTKCSL